MNEPTRFNIEWKPFAYRVSLPNYEGGEVVKAEDYDVVKAELEALKAGAQVYYQVDWRVTANADWCFISRRLDTQQEGRDYLDYWRARAPKDEFRLARVTTCKQTEVVEE